MSNITLLRPTRRVTTTVHQVTFDLVPRNLLEEVFHAAIAVGWAADEGAYDDDCGDADKAEAAERMATLQKAVNAASQFTVPVQREVDEPIHPAHGAPA